MLQGHKMIVSSCAFSPDGQYFASGSFDGTVKIWDILHRTEIKTLSVSFLSTDVSQVIKMTFLSSLATNIVKFNPTFVMSVNYNTAGTHLVTAHGDSKVRIWNLISGTIELTFSGHNHRVNYACFHPNDRLVLSCSNKGEQNDDCLILWDSTTGLIIRQFKSGECVTFNCAQFSLDGRTIVAACADKTIKVWDAETGILRNTLLGHSADVCSIAVDPRHGSGNNSSYLRVLSGALDGVVRVWTAMTPAKPATMVRLHVSSSKKNLFEATSVAKRMDMFAVVKISKQLTGTHFDDDK